MSLQEKNSFLNPTNKQKKAFWFHEGTNDVSKWAQMGTGGPLKMIMQQS